MRRIILNRKILPTKHSAIEKQGLAIKSARFSFSKEFQAINNLNIIIFKFPSNIRTNTSSAQLVCVCFALSLKFFQTLLDCFKFFRHMIIDFPFFYFL